MYEHVSKNDLIVFAGELGDVLFIDSSQCFHYGSRNSVVPRFQMMYGLTSPCRAGMTMCIDRQIAYPLAEDEVGVADRF